MKKSKYDFSYTVDTMGYWIFRYPIVKRRFALGVALPFRLLHAISLYCPLERQGRNLEWRLCKYLLPRSQLNGQRGKITLIKTYILAFTLKLEIRIPMMKFKKNNTVREPFFQNIVREKTKKLWQCWIFFFFQIVIIFFM